MNGKERNEDTLTKPETIQKNRNAIPKWDTHSSICIERKEMEKIVWPKRPELDSLFICFVQIVQLLNLTLSFGLKIKEKKNKNENKNEEYHKILNGNMTGYIDRCAIKIDWAISFVSNFQWMPNAKWPKIINYYLYAKFKWKMQWLFSTVILLKFKFPKTQAKEKTNEKKKEKCFCFSFRAII